MSETERYHEYILRVTRQANEQDDVKRGPFPKRFGFTCGNCGAVHTTREELQNCREIG